MPVVIDLNGVGVRELAGQADFAFKTRHRGGIRAARQQQFDGGVPAQQRMAGAIDHAHAALADFFLHRVLAQLLQFQFSGVQALPPCEIGVREHKHSRRAQHQAEHQDHEDQLQYAQRTVGFIGINLRRHAKAKLRQPARSAHHRHSPIVPPGTHIYFILAIHCAGDQPGQGPGIILGVIGLETFRQVAAGIAQAEIQRRAGVGGVQQAQFLQLRIKPALGNH